MPRREPERTCIVTRKVRDPAQMIRFVLAPDGSVVPDLKRRLPGRGVWASASAKMVEEAVRRRLFARAFKAEAKASPDLASELDKALLDDLRRALSLANKAGAVTTGFTKVEAAIGKGQLAALIHAQDAAPDGRRKLAGALRKQYGETIFAIPIIDQLSSDELDMALGRVHVIHAALLTGAGSDGCLACWRRLQAYRGIGEDAELAPDLDIESDTEIDADEHAASKTAGSEQDLVNE
jgi:predicted RNA-binding protein YlxR (DUF448 family)